jgi:cytochrome c553
VVRTSNIEHRTLYVDAHDDRPVGTRLPFDVRRPLFVLLLTASTVAAADAPPEAQDPGAVAFRQHCMACHMESGHGIEALKAPSIAGLPRWYVASQLRRFRYGVRGSHKEDTTGALMAEVTSRLDEREIAFLSRHVSNMQPNGKKKTLEGGDKKRGAMLFKETCMECHRYNATGERVFRSAPLNRQQDWYLLAQLKKFKSNQRGHTESDEQGVKMRTVTRDLDLKTDARDILAFITSLKDEPARETRAPQQPDSVPKAKANAH